MLDGRVASEQFLPDPRIVEPKYDMVDGSVWEIDENGDNPLKTTDETKPLGGLRRAQLSRR